MILHSTKQGVRRNYFQNGHSNSQFEVEEVPSGRTQNNDTLEQAKLRVSI